ncbi:MAG: hypothetical protein WBH31_13235 [Promethearchaeia archaeon]
MTKIDKKRKIKYSVIAVIIIFAMIAPGVYKFIDIPSGGKKNVDDKWFDPYLSAFFSEDDVDLSTYPFNAWNESYAIFKIRNTAYSNITLDGQMYNISYGMNYIAIDFGEENQSHTLYLDPTDVNNDVYEWISVQPVVIKSGFIDINPVTTTSINFEAGGSVSFLLYWNMTKNNNFTYDELYVEYDGTVINEIRGDWNHDIEIDPMLISTLRFGGPYLVYKMFMKPGNHEIKLKGNATIKYKLVVEGDWDDDGLSNIEEVQKGETNDFYNLLVPLIHGSFLMGAGYKVIHDYENERGLYFLKIPEGYKEQYLSIQIFSGSIRNIVVDDDEYTFKDKIVKQTGDMVPTTLYYGKLFPGNHFVRYEYFEPCVVFIRFFLNWTEVFTCPNDGADSDSDGARDVQEGKMNTNRFNSDSDFDGLIDGFDPSPLSTISLNNSKISEFVILTNKSRDTLVTVSIDVPETDYTTKDSMIWKDMEVYIMPGMRIFGSSSLGFNNLYDLYGKKMESYDITGTNPIYGDFYPDTYNITSEHVIVNPQIANESISFNLLYSSENQAKDDSKIILRFDFVWVVVSPETEYIKILHYYEIEEPIIIQSVNVREICPMNYILGSPDSAIENLILWDLVQNSDLGSFSDFGVSEDVVSSGVVNYSKIVDTIKNIRETNPISKDEYGNIDETDVIYFSYLYSEYDLLENTTNNLFWTSLREDQRKGCKVETFVSNYIEGVISDESLLDADFILAPNENLRICYQKAYSNYSSEASSLELRYDIFQYPIFMDDISFSDGNILEEVMASGSGIPLDKFPYTIDSVIHDKIEFNNYTVIESKEFYLDPLDIALSEYDEIKYVFDSRLFEVSLSDLIFNDYSISYIDRLVLSLYRHNPYYEDNPVLMFLYKMLPFGWEISGKDVARAVLEFIVVVLPVLDLKLSAYMLQFASLQGLYLGIPDNLYSTIPKGEFRSYLTDLRLHDFIAPFVGGDHTRKVTFDQTLDWILKYKFQAYRAEGLKYLATATEPPYPAWYIQQMENLINSGPDWILTRKQNFYELLEYIQKEELFTPFGEEATYRKIRLFEAMVDMYRYVPSDDVYKFIEEQFKVFKDGVLFGFPDDIAAEVIEALGGEENVVKIMDNMADNLVDDVDLELALKGAHKYYSDIMEYQLDKAVRQHFKDMHAYHDTEDILKKYHLSHGSTASLAMAVGIFCGITTIFSAIGDFEVSKNLMDAGEYEKAANRFWLGVTKFAFGVTMIASVTLAWAKLTLVPDGAKYAVFLTRAAKFSGILFQVANVFFDFFVYQGYWEKIGKSELSTELKYFWYSMVILSFGISAYLSITATLVLLGVKLGAVLSSYIPVIGMIIQLILLICLLVLFPDDTSDGTAGVVSTNTSIKFPAEKVRNKGSFEVGDLIEFYNEIESTGTLTTYVHSRINPGESGWSDWDGEWDSGYTQDDTDTINPNKTLSSPQTCLYLEIENEIAVWHDSTKKTVWSDVSPSVIPLPVLDSNIKNFYGSLTENPNKQYQTTYDQLRANHVKYKDTLDFAKQADIANKLSQNVTYDFLEDTVGQGPVGWDETGEDENEFSLILRPVQETYNNWWTPYGDSPIDKCIDDDTIYPTIGDLTDYVQGGWLSGGFEVKLGADQTIIDSKKITNVKIYMYTYSPWTQGANAELDIYWQSNSSAPLSSMWDFTDYGGEYAWHSHQWSGLNVLDDLSDFRIEVWESQLASVTIEIYQMYLLVEYESDQPQDLETVIVSGYKGHTNVVNLTCYGEKAESRIYDILTTTKYSGTVDFWLCKNMYANFKFEDFFYIDAVGSIWNHDKSSFIRKRPIEIEQWTHFSVVFGTSTFDLYVNGIQCGDDISHDSSGLGSIILEISHEYHFLDPTKTNISSVYIDAIDFSWDTPGYYQWRSFAWDYSRANTTYYSSIYNNLPIKTTVSTDFKENIVEMDTSTKVALFVFDFDLQGTDNPDIDIELLNIPSGFTANTTSIEDQKLQDRVHFKITDTGADDYAGIYYFDMNVTLDSDSTVIYYERVPFMIPVVEDYDIDQPSLLFEELDVEGNYTATFDFIEDEVGENPSGLLVYEYFGEVQVISELGDHYQVVEIYNTGAPYTSVVDWEFPQQDDGTIEWWWRTSNSSGESYAYLYGGQSSIILRIQDGYFQYVTGLTSSFNIGKAESDIWYHMRLEFNTSTDRCFVFINGRCTNDDGGYKFYHVGNAVEYFEFEVRSFGGTYLYVDAIGYSWDSNYDVGDNKYQTDICLNLDSSVQVSKGDFLVLDFKSNSINSLDLTLKNNDVVQNVYNIMSSGFQSGHIRTANIMINETFTFDKIEIEADGFRWFVLHRIHAISTTESIGEQFNPVNITNDGNYPLFFEFDISGVEADASGGGGGGDQTRNSDDQASVDRDGKRSWYSDVTDAETQDDETTFTYAYPSANYSDWLRVDDFGFTIPGGSTITGIKVEIDKYSSTSSNAKDSSLRLRTSSGQKGDDKADTSNWWQSSDTDTYDVYGGSSDLWGTTWTVSEINSEDFGVDFSANFAKTLKAGHVDHIKVTVYYSGEAGDPGGPYEPQYVTVLPGETKEVDFDLDTPDTVYSNLYYRKIQYEMIGTDVNGIYIDNLEINGIYIDSIINNSGFDVYGDKGNPKLNLRFVPEETLIWCGYSIDESENVTISGSKSTKVSFPETKGLHTIQIFGNNSGGTMFCSEFKTFKINYPIRINSPNKTENTKNHLISGEVDSFSSTDVGDDPEGWTVVANENTIVLHITGMTIQYGTKYGDYADSWVDDEDSFYIEAEPSGPMKKVYADISFGTSLEGRDYYISCDMVMDPEVPSEAEIFIDGSTWREGAVLDFDQEVRANTNFISLRYSSYSDFIVNISFFEIETVEKRGNVEVVHSMNGKSKPVEIWNNDVNLEYSIERTFLEGHTNGNVSFSILRESVTTRDTVLITLKGSGGTMVYTLENNDLYYGSYSTKTLLESNILKANKWHEFTIFFNISGGCQIFVDGVKYVPDGYDYAPFSTGDPTDITGIKVETVYWMFGDPYKFWFVNFRLGEIRCGFMLYSSSVFSELQYSFDGGSNKSFENCEVFSFPSSGTHSIVFYGNDIYGFGYQSENRTFTTETTYDYYAPLEEHEMPTQWTDYVFTYGDPGDTGSTEYDDGVYAYMDAEEVLSGDTYLGYIEPNVDIIADWNEGNGGSHWAHLNEATEDMNGDGLNIRETSEGVHDRWGFTSLTIPEGAYVSKLEVYGYCKRGLGYGNYIRLLSNKFSGLHWWTPGQGSYAWKLRTVTGLNLDQDDLDEFYLDVYNEYGEPPNSYADIETVYVKVYYKVLEYRITCEVTMTIPSEDLVEINTLFYDYATTYAVDCDLDIYNWDTPGYEELKSFTTTDYITDSKTLTDPYISGSNEIKIRFETAVSLGSDFDIRIDQLMVLYKATGKKEL